MTRSISTVASVFAALIIVLLLSQFGYYPTWGVIFHGLKMLWLDTTTGNLSQAYAGISWIFLFYSLRLIVAAMIFTFAGGYFLTIAPLNIKWKPAAVAFEFVATILESVPDTIYIILTVILFVYLLQTFSIDLPIFNTLNPTWNDTWIPALALALPGAFHLRRILTIQLSDESHAPYVDTARAKGASPRRIFYRHILPNLNAVAIRQIPMVATIILSTILFAEFFLEYKGEMFQLSNAVGINSNSGLTTTPYYSGTLFVIGATLVLLWWLFHALSQRMYTALYPGDFAPTGSHRQTRIQWRWIALGGTLLALILVVGIFPKLLTPFTPTHEDTGSLNQTGPPFVPLMPSHVHPFGTDMFGHDILAQTLYGTLGTLWPAALIAVCVLVFSLLLSALAIATSSRLLVSVLKFVSETLSAIPAFFVLFLALYHRIDTTWLQILQYISWFVLFEIGRGSYSFYQMMLQWYQFAFIEGAVSVGRSRFAILRSHLTPWLSRYLLEFSFSEFVRILSLMAQLATLHVYLTVVIGFLPFRPFTGMTWPLGIVSKFPNWLGMIGDSTLSMTYLTYPFFLAAPLIALTMTVVSGNLVARGIRGAER